MKEYIESEFDTIANNFLALKALSSDIEQVAILCIDAIKRGNKIMFCGNSVPRRIRSIWRRNWSDAIK